MKTIPQGSHPVLSQTLNNTTLWIGHLKTDPHDHLAGQTFKCPSEGRLNNIQVYSAAVAKPGELVLTVHEFDAASKTWGPAIGHSTLSLKSGDAPKWIRFELQPVALQKNATYGFRLETSDAFVGIGEAASHAHSPFSFGLAWNGESADEKGRFFSYFSLAFKVELCA